MGKDQQSIQSPLTSQTGFDSSASFRAVRSRRLSPLGVGPVSATLGDAVEGGQG